MQTGVIVIWQSAFQSRIVLFYRKQSSINLQSNVVLLCVLDNITPTAFLRQIEHVFLRIERFHIGVFFAVGFNDLLSAFHKFITCEFKEEQTQNNVLVFGRLNSATKFIRTFPKSFLHRYFFFRFCCRPRHSCDLSFCIVISALFSVIYLPVEFLRCRRVSSQAHGKSLPIHR